MPSGADAAGDDRRDAEDVERDRGVAGGGVVVEDLDVGGDEGGDWPAGRVDRPVEGDGERHGAAARPRRYGIGPMVLLTTRGPAAMTIGRNRRTGLDVGRCYDLTSRLPAHSG